MAEVKIHRRLLEPEVSQAYGLYRRAMDPLQRRTIMKEVLDGDEFFNVCNEKYFEKHVLYRDDGSMAGLGTVTNVLSAEHAIGFNYFAHNHRADYEAGKIFYVGFIFPVRPDPMFDLILKSMTAGRMDNGEQFFMDFCGFNELAGLPAKSEELLRANNDQVVVERVDWVGYWRVYWRQQKGEQ